MFRNMEIEVGLPAKVKGTPNNPIKNITIFTISQIPKNDSLMLYLTMTHFSQEGINCNGSLACQTPFSAFTKGLVIPI